MMRIDLGALEVQETLTQDLWDGVRLKEDVRRKLLEIAMEFVDWLEIDVPLHDVLFTGSLANYNWSKYSDIDLHPLIDYSDVDEDVDLVRDLLMSKKSIWNDRFDIRVRGYPVELYAQNVGEPHHSTGVYSVRRGKWLTRPSREDPQVDLRAVREKADAMADMIDLALRNVDCSEGCLDRVKDRIKDMRQSGLETGGEFSVENLAFKALRRNGSLDRLYDEADRRLERELSLESAMRPTRKYVHFTSEEDARKIVETGYIMKSSYVGSAVYAVMVGGAYVPSVQRSKMGRTSNRDWAVIFEADELPDIAYPEEVMWHVDELPVRNPRVVPAERAAMLLDDSILRNDDDELDVELHPSSLDSEFMRIREQHEPTLEEYRQEVLDSVMSLGSWYKAEATELLGVPVEQVWIHGSVLDPSEFSEGSDVDIALVVDMSDRPQGLLDDLSELIAGELPDGLYGVVDVLVLNNEAPPGRAVPPKRIA